MHLPSARGGDAHHRLGAVVERGDPRQQHVAQRRRQAFAVPVRGGQQLLGEERVALRAREDGLEELRRRRRAEDPGELLVHVRARQAIESEPLHRRGRCHVGEEAPQVLAPVDLVVAVGRDHEHALVAQPAREEPQQLERRAVGPVDVLDHQHDGAGGGRLREPIEDDDVQP